MHIANMAMVVFCVCALVDIISGGLPAEKYAEVFRIMEFIAAVWFFIEFVPGLLAKMKQDSKFRDFVYAMTISLGIVICLGYSHPELQTNEWALTGLMLVIFFGILVLKRASKIYLAKKSSKKEEESTDL